MSNYNYTAFFKAATGHEPFDYQRRLAEDPECKSRLIEIPTGLGKTAAVVLAWLWNRVIVSSINNQQSTINQHWPRRLVYCLPMRTLVEQTRDNVRAWLRNLNDLEWDRKPHTHAGKVGLHVLMGGEGREENPWDLYPEHDAILIGTQDMLLSRALNRGYGMSRYRWPIHFGLLNNDALWVFDEVQLMGAGVPTTAQLEAFRRAWPPAQNCFSWWMSATLSPGWLETVDLDLKTLLPPIELEERDREHAEVKQRREAPKPLRKASATAEATRDLAAEVLGRATTGNGLTLVVVNTVERAMLFYRHVKSALKKDPRELPTLLIHSRFRPPERREKMRWLAELATRGPALVISTQVVEAGVDISAETLVTELAPWPSLIQRFGRCNRRGREKEPKVIWIPLDEEKSAAPYESGELSSARSRLETLGDVGLVALEAHPVTAEEKPYAVHVIRRKDLLDLFDTTPDLACNDVDIDRLIRDADDTAVQVFWRDWPGAREGQAPELSLPASHRDELCPAPIGQFRDFVKKRAAFTWDYLDRQWAPANARRIVPGRNYLLPRTAGGYLAETGWDPSATAVVELIASVRPQQHEPDSQEAESLSETKGAWKSIAEHTDEVVAELDRILVRIEVAETEALRIAARWHDLGKAHGVFQNAIRTERDGQLRPEPWRNGHCVAKAPAGWWIRRRTREGGWSTYERRYFRHELASALAVLQPACAIAEGFRDLVAYVIAAHHGKIRLSLRSLPGEDQPPDAKRFARGVWDQDPLPPTPLGDNILSPAIRLSLEPMELGLCEHEPFAGQLSWAERMLALRDKLGPFQLALLESLLRAADERASAAMVMPQTL